MVADNEHLNPQETDKKIEEFRKEKKRGAILQILAAATALLVLVGAIFIFNTQQNTIDRLEASDSRKDSRIETLETANDAGREQFLRCINTSTKKDSSCSAPVSPKSEDIPGPTGPAGAPGLPGIPGLRGIPGIPGIPGVGSAGSEGTPGIPGTPGEKGSAGEKGSNGEKGSQGDKGEKGDTGPQGDKGEKGDRGDTGPQGDKGEAGPAGAPGADGALCPGGGSLRSYTVLTSEGVTTFLACPAG